MFILTCSEIGAHGECCPGCRLKQLDMTIVYPAGLYSGPDQSMGIKAAVCCHHIHYARGLTRGWWLTQLMRRLPNRYRERDIIQLVSVVDSKDLYYKTWAKVHEGVQAREKSEPKSVRRGVSSCPSCGTLWDQTVCNACGQMGA